MSATSEPDRGAREAALFRPAARAVQAGQLRGFAFGRGRYPGHRLRGGHLPGVDSSVSGMPSSIRTGASAGTATKASN